MSRSASVNAQPAQAMAIRRADTAAAGTAAWTPRLRLIAAALLTALGVLVCLDAWHDVFLFALRDEEFSHIFLVPVVVVWLVMSRREVWSGIHLQSSMVGPALIVVGGLLNAYGFYNLTQVAWHGGALLVAVGCFLTIAGWRVAWQLLPAFVVLLFLLPVPARIRSEIAIPLQYATASATTAIYELFAQPIEQYGSVIRYNGMEVAVAEACNGMRMVFALVLVTYAVAFAMPLRNSIRLLLLALTPLLAIVCNVIRLVPTVWVYGNFSEGVAKAFHDLSGWVMIGVAFFLIMGIVSLLQWLDVPVMQAKQADREVAT